jgi:hypothetical protein
MRRGADAVRYGLQGLIIIIIMKPSIELPAFAHGTTQHSLLRGACNSGVAEPNDSLHQWYTGWPSHAPSHAMHKPRGTTAEQQ